MSTATVGGLFIYPLKSCRGIALEQAMLGAAGFLNDRRWMLIDERRRFVTQRDDGRLALIAPQLQGEGLRVSAPGMPVLDVPGASTAQPVSAGIWGDECAAFDEGGDAAGWFSEFLHRVVRLVRFDDARPRLSSRDWTGDVEAQNLFSDGFPLLLIGSASLADLNARMAAPLPMNRFRPNIVIDGLPAYGEDRVHELRADGLRLRVVKPCTRCKITTTDQTTGIAEGAEPLATLRSYRFDKGLKGVIFGQNVIAVQGEGAALRLGQELQVIGRQQA